MELLQEKIRKMKCPVVVDMSLQPSHIPAEFSQGKDAAEAMEDYCRCLLTALKGAVPGARFNFDQWALCNGLERLSQLLRYAHSLGFYVLLDGPAVLSPWEAERAAMLLDQDSTWYCDGLVISAFIGSDAVKPFVPVCKEGKNVFFAVRTPNRSASELQDLMTGARLSHVAVAEYVNRLGEPIYTKCGYSPIGLVTAATNAIAVSGLRAKHNRMFLLVDGLDYPGGNGKNCSYGFDRFGHGCAVSVGPAITAAWQENGDGNCDPAAAALQAVERIRNNLARYVTIL